MSDQAQIISDDEFERELAELEGRPAPDSTIPQLEHEIMEAAAPKEDDAGGHSATASSAGEPTIVRRASYMGLGPYPSSNTTQLQLGASGSHFGDSNKKKTEGKISQPSGAK